MSISIEIPIHFKRARAGRKEVVSGPPPTPQPIPSDPIPRVSRLMALAIHFDDLIQRGVVRDYADLARLGGVTRARITQIMNLLNLAPEIQEALLFAGRLSAGGAVVKERYTRGVSASLDWAAQRRSIDLTIKSECATRPQTAA